MKLRKDIINTNNTEVIYLSKVMNPLMLHCSLQENLKVHNQIVTNQKLNINKQLIRSQCIYLNEYINKIQ
jgi:hypothetical protein